MVLVYKSGLRILIQAPRVPFWYQQKAKIISELFVDQKIVDFGPHPNFEDNGKQRANNKDHGY